MNEQEIRNIAAVGDGWLDVVINVDLQLERLDPGYTIEQVKEKFGGLRYYYTPTENATGTTAAMMELIVDTAERVCEKTCETCGQPGDLHQGGWLRTLCDGCEADYQTKRKARGDE